MKTLSGSRNQCPTCTQYFNSNYVFDMHRVGKPGSLNRRCRTPEEMLQKGMGLNKDGFWISEPISPEMIKKLREKS